MEFFDFQPRIRGEVTFDEQAKVFVTYIPALGIYSQAESEAQAKTALRDAVEGWFTTHHKMVMRGTWG